ncbi:MAG: response regulator [Planctomycetota bacterium]|nr:response regulator [Planctomycetota bacterium]
MRPDTEGKELRERIEQLETELSALRLQSRKVAEANARAALDAAERHLELTTQGAELKAALEEARVAVRRKDEFIAKVSHELRTPLNAVLGMSELLADTELTSLQLELVRTTNEAGRSLRELIDDLLDFSRISGAQARIECSPVDCWEVCEEATALLQFQAAEKGISLALRIESGAPRFVSGNVTRLRQVLVNLLGNAVKFTVSGGVSLRLSGEGTLARFEVIDTGPGIRREDLERIFQPFEQADNSASRSFGGAGLGLAISSGLATAMGGRLEADSRPGEGSTFTLRMPGVAEPGAVAARPAAFDRSILVTTDPALREVHAEHASTVGVAALAVEEAASVLTELGDGSARDLVLLDLCSLDVRLGAKIIEQLQAGAPEVRIARILPDSLERDEVGQGLAALRQPLRVTRLDRLLREGRLDRRAVTEEEALPDPVGFEGIRVMLVEDNRVNQRVAQRMLEKTGCSIEICSSGEEAIGAFDRLRPDIVLMDCQMPGIDGYEATRRLRDLEQESRRTPIIALTAHASDQDRSRCIEAGMDDHITKPIESDQLSATLARWGAQVSGDPQR